MSEKNNNIVTRFAPSPTGFMHVGGVRTALYAWLWARKNNGTFILRIEDTDKEREVEGSILHIQESLKWLGLNWDFGPDAPGPAGSYIQSERLDVYRRYAHILIDKGFAYPDPYTEEELETFRDVLVADAGEGEPDVLTLFARLWATEVSTRAERHAGVVERGRGERRDVAESHARHDIGDLREQVEGRLGLGAHETVDLGQDVVPGVFHVTA